MKKFVALSFIVPVALGLSACGTPANNSADVAVNADDANLTVSDETNISDSSDNVADANATVANAQ